MYAASDREVYIGVGSDQMFARLCAELDCEELCADPRFATNGARIDHREVLDELLAPRLNRHTAAELVAICDRLGIPSSEVNTVADIAQQEQALARDMVVETGIEGVRTAGIPFKLDRTPGRIRRPPPRLGEDNDALIGTEDRAGSPR
jgi:crotonobetainyl-CoA:carnitine CoA-transferase CaiB-like acyl-CoA transferase